MDRSGQWSQPPEDVRAIVGQPQARDREKTRTSSRNEAGVTWGPGT